MNSIAYKSVLAVAVLSCGGCSSTRQQPVADAGPMMEVPLLDSRTVMPKARVYRTNGDYRDRVPVNMNASLKSIVSYPAPSDLKNTPLPVILEDGYLLDQRGIGANTAFTLYTYAEYAALAQAPSTDELMAAIIPGACVTEIVDLPMTTSEALADTAACNALISADFPGCTRIGGAQVVIPYVSE